MKKATDVVKDAVNGVEEVKNGLLEKIKIDPEIIIRKAIKLPGVRINRDQYLQKELSPHFADKVVQQAIDRNPAYAGIPRDEIDPIAEKAIALETRKVSAISFATGIPGGLLSKPMAVTDIVQYFGFILRATQKLAYLYGFEDLGLDAENVPDETMNQLFLFLGVVFGVQGANEAVKKLAASTSVKVAKSMAQKPLTKGFVYPIVKRVARALGQKMTKQVFANGVSKVVPVVGGVITGGLSYVTYKPCMRKLKKEFRELSLSDPEVYKNQEVIIDVDYTETIDESDNSK
jgi:hypothetical protein